MIKYTYIELELMLRRFKSGDFKPPPKYANRVSDFVGDLEAEIERRLITILKDYEQ